MLTAIEIHRVRDLIALGPLTAEDCDVNLIRLGFAQMYFPLWVDDPNHADMLQKGLDRNREMLETGGEISLRKLIVEASPDARKKFYNKKGGVKGEHWKGSGKTFAEYVTLES